MAARSLNLFIGCGGSGLATLTSLNRLLAQNKGSLPRLEDEVYYLAVDTDLSALDNFERDIREQTGTSPAPFIQRVHLLEGIGDFDEVISPNFIEPFSLQPRAEGLKRLREHWWHDQNGNPFRPHGPKPVRGAPCPQVAYGLAWYRLEEIENAVRRIVDRMVAQGDGDSAQLGDMNLVVVAGLSGGTGRGCWNLVALKVRECLRDICQVTVPPVGVFFDAGVCDGAASGDAGQRLAREVNALTGLSELSSWIADGGKSDRFEFRLPGVKSPDRPEEDVLKVDLDPKAGSPVARAFLVCGRSGAASLENARQCHEMAGAALCAMIARPDVAARRANDGDRYGSFAAATFEVDALHIRRWYETRACGIALQRLVAVGEDVTAAKEVFFRSTPVNAAARVLADLRPDPDGTLYQRLAAALLAQDRYCRSLETMVQNFQQWRLADAEAAVEPLLAPASDVKSVVEQSLARMGLSPADVEAAVVEATKAVYRGEEGQRPSIGRALEFLKTIRSEVGAARALSAQSFRMMPEGGDEALDAGEAVLETLRKFSGRTFKEVVVGIGSYNPDEIDSLVRRDGGSYVGMIPSAVVAVNYPQLRAALEEALQPALMRINRLIVACEWFAECCREARAGFALDESRAAGGESGEDPFSLLFVTPDRIDESLYGRDDTRRLYRRVLRPVVASRAEAEALLDDSIVVGDGLEAFVDGAVEDGSFEALAVANDVETHRRFVNDLMALTRTNVGLRENFMERNFSFDKTLARNREEWNRAIAAAAGDGGRLAKLKDMFQYTLGAEPAGNPHSPAAPLALPPVEELRQTIAASLSGVCVPWWIVDAQDLSENRDEISLLLSPFGYLAFASEGVRPADAGKHPLDAVESLKYHQAPDVDAWLQKAERDDGESVFTTEGRGRGLGYVSPVYVRERALADRRWRPWLH